jgi:hypothetical protein
LAHEEIQNILLSVMRLLTLFRGGGCVLCRPLLVCATLRPLWKLWQVSLLANGLIDFSVGDWG